MEELDMLNYSLGQYVGISVNNPKKYPKKPFSYKEQLENMTDEEMERQARRNTLKLGGDIK